MAIGQEDQALLIDLLLGQDGEHVDAVKRRLDAEPDLRELHDSIANALSAAKRLPPVAPPDDLVQKTLHRIRQYQHTNELLAREQIGRTVRRPTFSLRELAAVAAILLVLVSVFGMWRSEARQKELSILCQGQLGQIGTGMTAYAHANDGFLPAARAQAGRWLDGSARAAASNSSALFRLVSSGYVDQRAFRCPGAAQERPRVEYDARSLRDFPQADDVTYSYQHSLGSRGLSIVQMGNLAGSMAILADRTPVFAGGRFVRSSVENHRAGRLVSPNHDESGQNVLYLNMRSAWSSGPLVGVNGDNIYLAGDITDYRGDEKPVSDTDTFLLPDFCSTPQP
ncbi:MAG: hypothetical protein LLG01_00405 [Planctomycetaceae bacterium]|nr:hypothetical protein [Planctomycetaceae bacterium]